MTDLSKQTWLAWVMGPTCWLWMLTSLSGGCATTPDSIRHPSTDIAHGGHHAVVAEEATGELPDREPGTTRPFIARHDEGTVSTEAIPRGTSSVARVAFEGSGDDSPTSQNVSRNMDATPSSSAPETNFALSLADKEGPLQATQEEQGAHDESAESRNEVCLGREGEVRSDRPLPPREHVEITPLASDGSGHSTGLADRSTKSAESEEPAPPIAIDLPTALAITAGQNPQVAFARQRIREAWSEVELAQVLWVPSLRAGFNYNKHEGRIQDVAGEIIETSRGSLYSGFGSQTVGAGSPAVPGLIMNFHLRDAIFEPEIAQQVLGRRRHASRAVTNDMLLETATAYTDLLEALQIQAVAKDTLDHAELLAKLTSDFSETGQGLQADADRARAELSVRRVELSRADEGVRTARVRLVRLLSWAQPEPPEPQEPVLIPIDMISREVELPELISLGLTNRPELSEARHLVGEAVQRLRREQYAPLVPSVLLGVSYGVNGGGLGSDLIRFGDRLDMDAAAFWEIRQLGFGERAARAVAGSRLDQARWEQVRQMDQVAADVAEAHAQVMERHRQIEWSQEGITSAELSYRRNQERIQDGQGLPLEALQAIQALDQARRQYVRSVADYNRSQFQLHRAVGWPAE